jgi:hypothetical protein
VVESASVRGQDHVEENPVYALRTACRFGLRCVASYLRAVPKRQNGDRYPALSRVYPCDEEVVRDVNKIYPRTAIEAEEQIRGGGLTHVSGAPAYGV